jgi:uncharacterized protein
MHSYLRDKPAWMQLLIFGFLTVGIYLVVLIVGFTLVAQLNHLNTSQVISMTSADFAKPENATLIKELLGLQLFIFVLPALVFAYLADPHPFYYAGLRPPQKKSFLLIAFLTIILAYLTVAFLSMINEAIVHQLPARIQKWIMSGEDNANGPLENVLAMKSPADLMKLIILVGVLPAVGEELFFRGILQRLFIQIFKKPWPGIIFTGFLFSAFHMQFMGFLPRMALGIILGALYWYSGSLLAAILGHFVFNSINVLFIYFKVADLDSKTNYSIGFAALGIFSVVGVVFLLNYLRKNSLTRYEDEFPPSSDQMSIDKRG